jgi:aryl-alcohol dehydrogenase-like predicted oxidoreductase
MAEAAFARRLFYNKEVFGLTEKVQRLAQQGGRTPLELTLGWALANPAITAAIVGASKPEQIAQNAKATEVALTSEELAACSAL